MTNSRVEALFISQVLPNGVCAMGYRHTTVCFLSDGDINRAVIVA
jgi:hypothetical protein